MKYKKPTKLDKRRLAVEDPVEMRTEPGTEILIPATPEEHKADEGHRELHETRKLDEVSVKGLGRVTPYPQGRR